MFRDLSRGFEKLFFAEKIVEWWGSSEIPVAAHASDRPLYHIEMDLSRKIFSSKCTKNLSALGGQTFSFGGKPE